MAKTVLVAIVFILFAVAAYGEVWGSARSRTYHYRLCRWNAKIKKEYRVSFPSPAAARKAGYLPCEKCRPPATDSAVRMKPA